MAEDIEHAFEEIKDRLKSRLLSALVSIRALSDDPEQDKRNTKAAREKVEKAGQDALDELRGLFQ